MTRMRIVAGLALGSLAAFAAVQPAAATLVEPTSEDSIVAGVRAAPGEISWFADVIGSASFAVEQSFSGSDALHLSASTTPSSIRVLRSYGSGTTPTDIPALLEGASYTYSGSSTNFQIEIFYTPNDSVFDPDPSNGTNRCTQASDNGVALQGQCYTVLKWEPFENTSDSWKTIDLSADTAANSATQTGGWISTNRVGPFAKPGPIIGQTLSTYLNQMASYSVIGVGVSIGSGGVDLGSWVREVTISATSYRFGLSARPAPPTFAGVDRSTTPSSLHGSGIPGAIVFATVGNGTAVGSGVVDDTGTWRIELSSNPDAGSEVQLVQSIDGVDSLPLSVNLEDAPVVNPMVALIIILGACVVALVGTDARSRLRRVGKSRELPPIRER
jgi:hypothetical protein